MTNERDCSCDDHANERQSLIFDASRRDFMRMAALGSIGFLATNGLGMTMAFGDEGTKTARKGGGGAAAGKAKSLVVLYMSGGMSQLDTWDPKPDHKNGGPYVPIETAVSGMRISPHLPGVAKVANDIAIIRSMTSKEGNHDRARYLLHTGYPPGGAVKHPSLGSVISNEIGDPDSPLPSYCSIGGAAYGSGFLGVRHAPLIMRNPQKPVDDLATPDGVTEKRYDRRLALLKMFGDRFGKSRGDSELVADRQKVTDRAVRLMRSEARSAFDISGEPAKRLAAYGQSKFGQGCLLAAKAVEQGIRVIEVTLGGWDTHRENFEKVASNSQQLDRGMSALIADLRDRGLLESTVIMCMGEFGRTPRINANGGRDHFPRAWSAVLAGGGLKTGQVIGATSPDGMAPAERPVGVPDLMATVLARLGIDWEKEYISPNGRPLQLSDKGKPVAELLPATDIAD